MHRVYVIFGWEHLLGNGRKRIGVKLFALVLVILTAYGVLIVDITCIDITCICGVGGFSR
jgi:hypothetical protein